MNAILKKAVKRFADTSVAFCGRTAVGRHIYSQIINDVMSRTQQVTHRGVGLTFTIPNALCKFRADTFSTKEPATLEWIDEIPSGSVLWDIGANVGIYACYAAKSRACRVFAFEPSVFNLELLARNIFLNDLTGKVTIIPLPLSDELAVNRLNMTTTTWGGALSTFGKTYGQDGEPINKVFEIPTIGLSMVDAVRVLGIPQPDYVKMDVDGIEHLILKGGSSILRNVKGVLVEINDKFTAQAESAGNYLREAGLILRDKSNADALDPQPGAVPYIFNQLWAR